MYTVDADKITIRDAIALQNSKGDTEVILPILRKCVTVDDGRDIEDLPAKHFRLILKAINERMSGNDVGN